jgi:hypothetical protein
MAICQISIWVKQGRKEDRKSAKEYDTEQIWQEPLDLDIGIDVWS